MHTDAPPLLLTNFRVRFGSNAESGYLISKVSLFADEFVRCCCCCGLLLCLVVRDEHKQLASHANTRLPQCAYSLRTNSIYPACTCVFTTTSTPAYPAQELQFAARSLSVLCLLHSRFFCTLLLSHDGLDTSGISVQESRAAPRTLQHAYHIHAARLYAPTTTTYCYERMAAASIQPSPRTLSVMANRRLPLANNPNAANSPFRNVAPVSGKRTRAQATDARDLLQGQPPLKKQVIDLGNDENTAPRSFTRHSLGEKEAENKVFMRKPSNAPMTALERKLVAARERKPAQPQVQQHEEKSPEKKKSNDSLENIRQWQRHYKKAFPQFVFYFESVPDDVRRKISLQVQSLGAVSPTRGCVSLPPGSLTSSAERREVLLEISYPCRHHAKHPPRTSHHQPG